MKTETTRIEHPLAAGREVTSAEIWEFPEGLIGLPDYRSFALLELEDAPPFRLLASTDDPTFGGGALALWLSHRDTAQIHVKAVDAPDDLKYAVVYATSDNYWKIFSLDRAREVLGYEPQDDAGPELNPDSEMVERDRTEYKVHED